MSDHTPTDSAVAVDDSRDRVLLALEPLLKQCDDNNVPTLINQVRTKIARRHYALNARQCPLLNLPPELLVKIGEFVLETENRDTRSKYRFAREIFPLLQTSSQLRTQLQPLRSTPLNHCVRGEHPWSTITQSMKEWRQIGVHTGPVTIVLSPWRTVLKPSKTADLAESIERAIYGRLSSPPLVYIGLDLEFGGTRKEKDRMFYVSYRRAEGILVALHPCVLLEHLSPSSRVSREDGLEIWEQARRKTGDEAP